MIKNTAASVKTALKKIADPERAKVLSGYFKTGAGEYGEGDIFIGIKTDQSRKVIKEHPRLTLSEIKKLIYGKVHEHRSAGWGILVNQYLKGDEKTKKKNYKFYLENCKQANNWDLVDCSAPNLVGGYLMDHPGEKKTLYRLARSDNLWQRRIAIMATFPFIKRGKFEDTFKIAEILLNDQHDLIHKAVGWMLREVGKIDQKQEEVFLRKYCRRMPRTMLRYAIEKFDPEKRKFYMEKY
ncbi:MAG: DNA alkylation repair protein [Patescibacteria group bacterium]|nr:DNA alkylation repair protein [Patescibacteria group bacterium]